MPSLRIAALLLAALPGCMGRAPLTVSPETVGREVQLRLTEPRDVVGVRENGDSLLIVAVQRISGRLVGVAGDTATLNPVTSAETLNGRIVFGPDDPIVRAHVVTMSEPAAAARRSSDRASALAITMVVLIGLAGLVAAAWGQGPGG